MTPDQFKDALRILGLSYRDAAAFFGVSLTAVYNMSVNGPWPVVEILLAVMLEKRVSPDQADDIVLKMRASGSVPIKGKKQAR